MSADATDDTADRGAGDDRWREQNPDQRTDRDPSPGTVLGGLLMLMDVDLAVVVLVDHRGVIGADKLLSVKVSRIS